MNQDEYETMMKNAKDKYHADEKRKTMDKNNLRSRKWYKQNIDYVRAIKREWRREQYQKNRDKFLQKYEDMKMYTCPRCCITMKERVKYKHDHHSECGIAVNGAPQPWVCPICCKSMKPNNRWQHSTMTKCAEPLRILLKNKISTINSDDNNKPTDESIGEESGGGGD